MRNLCQHEWNEIIYMISTTPFILASLLMLFIVIYEQIISAITVIGN